MKHFQTFLSFALSLFFLTAHAQNASTDHVIVYNTDNYMGDITATFDGGWLIAGYFGREKDFEGETAFVQKFDSQHQLVWSCILDTIAVLAPYQSIINVQAVSVKDGSCILLISRFECDLYIYDYLVGISPAGQVMWHKELTGMIGGQLFTWIPFACAVVDGSGLHAFGPDGQELSAENQGEKPTFTLPLSNGRTLEGNVLRVWLVDSTGQQIGSFWEAPEYIHSADTLPGGDFMVLSKFYIFKLSPHLGLLSTIEKPGISDYEIHPYGDGYLALPHAGPQPYLYLWDENFTITDGYEMRHDILRHSWFSQQPNFFVKGDEVTIATSLSEWESTTIWTASFPATNNGVYATNVDLSINEIYFSGTPKGEITGILPTVPPKNTYKVDYTNVSVAIQNAGTDTIHHFVLNLRMKSCGPGPWCHGSDLVWRKSFDGYHLAPGETEIILFDSIYFDCTAADIRDFCIWASEVNYQSDDDTYNNSGCKFLSGIVSTNEAPGKLNFSVLPNPAIDVIRIQMPDFEEIAQYCLTDAAGKIVRNEISGNVQISVGDLPPGLYILKIRCKSGTEGRQPVVIAR